MDAIKKATTELSNELQKIGEVINKASQESAAAGQTGGEAPKDEKVRDADFEEKKSEDTK
jgi:hypothetical protein